MILPPVLQLVKDAGHAVFLDGAYNVNVVGFRGPSRTPDQFDDLMTVTCRKRTSGPLITWSWPCTTDPGLNPLVKPRHPAGVAILCPGQYRGVYMIDKHGGRYDALCQRNGRVLVWRDNNRDGIIDTGGRVYDDARGINIHAADSNPYDEYDKTRSKVGLWSEGCQVFQVSSHFREFMEIVRRATALWGPKVTFTLLEVPCK